MWRGVLVTQYTIKKEQVLYSSFMSIKTMGFLNVVEVQRSGTSIREQKPWYGWGKRIKKYASKEDFML